MGYDPIQVKNGIYLVHAGGKSKHLILIHGLQGDSSFRQEEDHMAALYNKLENEGVLTDYSVWALTYNTIYMPFDISGRWLAEDMLRLEGYDFSDSIIVGYSMGGLIARTMLCNGFNFKYLITIDTPHHGPVAGINFGLIPSFHAILSALNPLAGLGLQGIPSMVNTSKSQMDILNNPKDIAKRKNSYAFYAIDYRDHENDPYHGGDWVVSNHSQLGMDLGEIRWRYIWKKNYTQDDPSKGIGKPHSVASQPEYCQKAIELLYVLLAGEEMPSLALDEPSPSPNNETNIPDSFSTVEISKVNIWYFMDRDEETHIRAKVEIENKTTRPIEVPLDKVLLSRYGYFESQDKAVTKIILPPKSKRSIMFRQDFNYIEILPESIEIFSNGKMTPYSVYFTPMPINEAISVPDTSIWNMEIIDLKATYHYDSKEDRTFYTITGQVVNNSFISFLLYDWMLSIYLEGKDSVIDLDTDSDVYNWIAGSKHLTIVPNQKTPFKFSFVEYGNSSVKTVQMRIGSKAMPTFEQTITLTLKN